MIDQPAPPGGHASANTDEPHWIELPRTVNRLVHALYAICILLLVADVAVHKHSDFAIEHVLGFYGLYGFVGCVFLVLVAKAMRIVLMRPEDYYER